MIELYFMERLSDLSAESKFADKANMTMANGVMLS